MNTHHWMNQFEIVFSVNPVTSRCVLLDGCPPSKAHSKVDGKVSTVALSKQPNCLQKNHEPKTIHNEANDDMISHRGFNRFHQFLWYSTDTKWDHEMYGLSRFYRWSPLILSLIVIGPQRLAGGDRQYVECLFFLPYVHFEVATYVTVPLSPQRTENVRNPRRSDSLPIPSLVWHIGNFPSKCSSFILMNPIQQEHPQTLHRDRIDSKWWCFWPMKFHNVLYTFV